MTIVVRLLWMLGSALFSGVAATGMAWYVFTTTLTGFNTSQQTLSQQMNTLQGSLNQTNMVTDEKLAEARGNLATEIAGLSTTIRETLSRRLEENNVQLASLNATISGMDKRLNDTIERQRAFEAIYLNQRILGGPIPNEKSLFQKVSGQWAQVGVDTLQFAKVDEATAISTWIALNK